MLNSFRQSIAAYIAPILEEVVIDALEPYEYTPMPSPSSIRLLSFSNINEGPIECSLTTFELLEAPPYHALSYTWGSPHDSPNFELPEGEMYNSESLTGTYAKPPRKRIICDKLRMRAGLNLYEALRRLSGEDSPWMEQKYIWVDALCINQNDPDERSAQVLLMGEIYKRASSVIVWLGESLPETALALGVIEELERIPFSKHTEMERMSITDDNSYYSLGIRRISDREWRALLGFFRRQWFSRVWVVQEAVFARCIVFLCGNRTINPDTLFTVGKLLILSGWTSQIWEPYLPMLMAAPGPPPGGIAVISQMMEDLAKVEKPPPLNILASMRARN